MLAFRLLRHLIKWLAPLMIVALAVVWYHSQTSQMFWVNRGGPNIRADAGRIQFRQWSWTGLTRDWNFYLNPRPRKERYWWFEWTREPGWQSWSLDTPMWVPAAGLLLIGIAAWIPDVRAVLRRRRGRCPGCGYDRKGLDSAQPCPECGRVLPPISRVRK